MARIQALFCPLARPFQNRPELSIQEPAHEKKRKKHPPHGAYEAAWRTGDSDA
jgi:hypothetical protein